MRKTFLLLGAVFLLGQPVSAQTNGNWTSQASGNWSDPTRWSSNPNVPGGDGAVVNLTLDITANRTITIDTTSRTVGQLTIGDPNGSHAYTLAATGGAGLIFQNGGSAANLIYTSNALTGVVSAPLSLADSLVIANNSTNQQSITSATIAASTAGLKTMEIAGSGAGLIFMSGVITDGAGQVGIRINNALGGLSFGNAGNTFTGPVDLQAGRMVLIASFGNRPLNITGGSIESNGGNVRSISGDVTLNGTVSLGNAVNIGTIQMEVPTRTISLLGNSTINAVSGASISHVITGGHSLTKTGAGLLSLLSTNTFSGGFTLDGGQVRIGNASALGGGTITLKSGILHVASTASRILTNALSIGGSVGFGDGINFSTGSLTFSGPVALTADSMLTTQIGTTISGAVSGGFGLTKAGTNNLTLSGANTFSGATVVSSGSLILGANGSINSSSQVVVSQGANLTLNNNTTKFTTALAFQPGAILAGTGAFEPVSMTLLADLAGGAASFSSVASGTTSLLKSGTMEFTLSNPTIGQYTIFSGSNVNGSFASMTVGGAALNSLGNGNFSGSAGGFDYMFDNSTNMLEVVPEPSVWALLGVGAVVVLVARRRVRRADRVGPSIS